MHWVWLMWLVLLQESFILQRQRATLMLPVVAVMETHAPRHGAGTYLLIAYPFVKGCLVALLD